LIIIHNNPTEPAVIPTAIKKPNSTKNIEPGGIEMIIAAKKIMSKRTVLN